MIIQLTFSNIIEISGLVVYNYFRNK